MRNGTFKCAVFLLLKIESLDSAVYSKTKIAHCFLNLTLSGCFLGLWLLCIFKISAWNSFTGVTLSRERIDFHYLIRMTNVSLQHNIISLSTLNVQYLSSAPLTMVDGYSYQGKIEGSRAFEMMECERKIFLYYFLLKFWL